MIAHAPGWLAIGSLVAMQAAAMVVLVLRRAML